MQTSDVILVYHTSDLFWERMDRELATLREKVPVISLGPDPSFWGQSTVDPVVVTTCQRYITNSGEENFVSLLLFIKKNFSMKQSRFCPRPICPGKGYTTRMPPLFSGRLMTILPGNADRARGQYRVGLIFSRTSWAAGNVDLEDQLIRELEAEGLGVIPVFTYAIQDDALGARGMAQVVTDHLTHEGVPRVDALIKLIPFLFGTTRDGQSKKAAAENGVGPA